MGCIACGRDFHNECQVSQPCCCGNRLVDEEEVKSSTGKGRPRVDGVITDSGGRKRAAVDYPIIKTMPCEWRNMANCGGGLHPIVGCITGLQVHRHHGPDKVTSNNDEGNVHRICPVCHNTWHAKNDKDYDGKIWRSTEANPVSPVHDPRPGTLDELVRGNK